MVNHMRHTKGHTRNRRSHHALSAMGVVLCADCGAPRQKHVACSKCGAYKGKKIIDLKAKVEKKAAKKKEKESTRTK